MKAINCAAIQIARQFKLHGNYGNAVHIYEEAWIAALALAMTGAHDALR